MPAAGGHVVPVAFLEGRSSPRVSRTREARGFAFVVADSDTSCNVMVRRATAYAPWGSDMLTCMFTLASACMAFIGASSAASAAAAQQAGRSDDAHCANAARIVAAGHPAKHDEQAYLTLTACGDIGAKALASGMATYANERDTLALEDFMREADAWRDANIMDAAITLATSSAATPEARVFAVRHLVMLLHPYMLFSYGGLTRKDSTVTTPDLVITTIGCPATMTSEAPDLVGTPLSANYADRIRVVLSSLANDTRAPAPVRRAASCMN